MGSRNPPNGDLTRKNIFKIKKKNPSPKFQSPQGWTGPVQGSHSGWMLAWCCPLLATVASANTFADLRGTRRDRALLPGTGLLSVEPQIGKCKDGEHGAFEKE
jgi:hypothetical protein